MTVSSNSLFKIVVVTPIYNEQENLYKFVDSIAKEVNFSCDIFFVDDGSDDDSLNILKAFVKEKTNLKYISLSRNIGHQIALRAGLEHVQDYDVVVMLDVDLQHPPSVINELITQWVAGSFIVYTKRLRGDEGFLKKN